MTEGLSDLQDNRPLPRNVKLLGAASLLNDVASEMIYPLMPQFFMTVLKVSSMKLHNVWMIALAFSGLTAAPSCFKLRTRTPTASRRD